MGFWGVVPLFGGNEDSPLGRCLRFGCWEHPLDPAVEGETEAHNPLTPPQNPTIRPQRFGGLKTPISGIMRQHSFLQKGIFWHVLPLFRGNGDSPLEWCLRNIFLQERDPSNPSGAGIGPVGHSQPPKQSRASLFHPPALLGSPWC